MDEETVLRYHDFNKKRKRGLWILWINEIAAVIWIWYQIKIYDWVFYLSVAYLVVSTLLLLNRIIKKKPKDNSNYIFGKLGDKMINISQKFILEAMMMSLSFIIIVDIFSFIWAIFFTKIEIVYKIIAGVSGFFGAIFMAAILINTFISYKQLIEVEQMGKLIEKNLKNPFLNDNLKGGLEKW